MPRYETAAQVDEMLEELMEGCLNDPLIRQALKSALLKGVELGLNIATEAQAIPHISTNDTETENNTDERPNGCDVVQ